MSKYHVSPIRQFFISLLTQKYTISQNLDLSAHNILTYYIFSQLLPHTHTHTPLNTFILTTWLTLRIKVANTCILTSTSGQAHLRQQNWTKTISWLFRFGCTLFVLFHYLQLLCYQQWAQVNPWCVGVIRRWRFWSMFFYFLLEWEKWGSALMEAMIRIKGGG